jgi:hypothetical protein
MGTKSPNDKVPIMDMTLKARQLSDELGLTDKSVFFLDGWVPYEDRVNYLLDATIAVSAHFDLPETPLFVSHPHSGLFLVRTAHFDHPR